MTALSDADRAVTEAWDDLMVRVAEPETGLALVENLVAAVRRRDAAIVLDEGTRYDDRTYRRDEAAKLFADRLMPAPSADPQPEVEVCYDDALTVRLRDFEVTVSADGGGRQLEIEGRLSSGTAWPRTGNVIHLERLSIPGRGVLEDIQASIYLFSVDDTTTMRISVYINAEGIS